MVVIQVCQSSEELVAKLSTYVTETLHQLEKEKSSTDIFTIGVSGGSMPTALTAAIKRSVDPTTKDCWRRVRFVFCDERRTPFDNIESTFGAYQRTLLADSDMSELFSQLNFVVIDPMLPVNECAIDYERRLRELLKAKNDEIPAVDLLLLGMGPDGHTCSLFPGHPLLMEKSLMVAPISDSPKPPPERVTLTLPAVNRAKYVAFVTTGEGKAESLKDVLENKQSELPSAMVKPDSGRVHWFIDDKAARLLSK